MLLRAGDQTDAAKWQSFSIRSVLGDTLHDNDEDDVAAEEDLNAVVDAALSPSPVHNGSSPGASSCSAAGDTSRVNPQDDDDDIQETAAALCRNGELRTFGNHWTATAFQTPSTAVALQQSAVFSNRCSNYGMTLVNTATAYCICMSV